MTAADIVPGPTARFSTKTPGLPQQSPSLYGVRNKGSHQLFFFLPDEICVSTEVGEVSLEDMLVNLQY